MSQEVLNDIELSTEWTVKFMVKMREKQGGYRQHDFMGNFIDIGQKSKSLLQILKNVRIVPNFDKRQRGILSIFRNDIKPVYEDPANAQGFYVRLMMMNSEENLKKCIEELNNLYEELQGDKSKWEQQLLRRLAPVVSPCDSLIINFIFMGLAGIVAPKEGMFNGIYTHIEEGVIKVDFWYDKKAKETSKQQIMDQFRMLLGEINDQYKFTGPNEIQYSLLNTLQAIDMIDYNQNKKQGGKQKGK